MGRRLVCKAQLKSIFTDNLIDENVSSSAVVFELDRPLQHQHHHDVRHGRLLAHRDALEGGVVQSADEPLLPPLIPAIIKQCTYTCVQSV